MTVAFLSYATQDRPQAEGIHDGLEVAGIDCWIAPDDIPAGTSWAAAIYQAIQQSRVFVLVLSRHANVSQEVERELTIARKQGIPVIPFLLEEVDLAPAFAYHLHAIQQLPAFRMSAEDALRALTRSIQRVPAPSAEPRPDSRAEQTPDWREVETQPAEPIGGGAIVGIDFGTTHSAVAVLAAAGPTVVLHHPDRSIPSVVYFGSGGEVLVGRAAFRHAVSNPSRTIGSIKRLLGRAYGDLGETAQRASFQIGRTADDEACVIVAGARHSLTSISARILSQLKQAAEESLGRGVGRAVISVPNGFGLEQKDALRAAARISGLEVVRLLKETSAAALAYGFGAEKDQTIAVCSFGGGGFEVSLVEIGEGVVEVKATTSDRHLGGDDLDERIRGWLIEDFKQTHRIDLSQDMTAMQRLKEAAQTAKIELSQVRETEINLPFITAGKSGPVHLSRRLTRAKLEMLAGDLIQRLVASCLQALKDAGLRREDVDEVVLVGGQSRMPAIEEQMQGVFGRKPRRMPAEEPVAVGAAIVAGVLEHAFQGPLLLDVLPLSLGIETLGGVFTRLIERNTTIPTRKSEIFSTAEDNQTSVEVLVLEGEREMAKDNRSLGIFHLNGIPAFPRGVPQIEVAFDVDSAGIVEVAAKDLGTGHEQRITISPSTARAASAARSRHARLAGRDLPACVR